MYKTEKINILKKSIDEKKMTTCWFSCDLAYSHFYITKVNDNLMVGAEEFDFFIKGYEIMKLSRLKKVKMRNDACDEINKYTGLVDKIKNYDINLSSFYTACKDIKQLDRIVMVYCDNSPSSYYVGKIEYVGKNSLYLYDFDSNGVWAEKGVKIPFRDIDGIAWDTTYTRGWELYFDKISPVNR